jgi:hypothetical protein
MRNFELLLNNALRRNKASFSKAMVNFIYELHPYEWFMLSDYKIPIYKEDLSSISFKINETINLKGNFIYFKEPQISSNYGKMPFHIKVKPWFEDFYPDKGAPTTKYKKFIVGFHNWNYECERLFWQSHNSDSHEEISKFDCYIDFEVGKSEFSTVVTNYYTPNVEAWSVYYDKLIQIHFSELNHTKTIRSKIFRHKRISEHIWLGLSYKKSSLHKSLKRDMDLPEDLEIEFSLDAGKTINSFGSIRNPLLPNPTFKLGTFGSIEMFHNGFDFQSMELNYKPEIIDTGEQYSIAFSKVLGEKIKKYAYYSIYMRSLSTREYFKYLESSLTAASGNIV